MARAWRSQKPSKLKGLIIEGQGWTIGVDLIGWLWGLFSTLFYSSFSNRGIKVDGLRAMDFRRQGKGKAVLQLASWARAG